MVAGTGAFLAFGEELKRNVDFIWSQRDLICLYHIKPYTIPTIKTLNEYTSVEAFVLVVLLLLLYPSIPSRTNNAITNAVDGKRIGRGISSNIGLGGDISELALRHVIPKVCWDLLGDFLGHDIYSLKPNIISILITILWIMIGR